MQPLPSFSGPVPRQTILFRYGWRLTAFAVNTLHQQCRLRPIGFRGHERSVGPPTVLECRRRQPHCWQCCWRVVSLAPPPASLAREQHPAAKTPCAAGPPRPAAGLARPAARPWRGRWRRAARACPRAKDPWQARLVVRVTAVMPVIDLPGPGLSGNATAADLLRLRPTGKAAKKRPPGGRPDAADAGNLPPVARRRPNPSGAAPPRPRPTGRAARKGPPARRPDATDAGNGRPGSTADAKRNRCRLGPALTHGTRTRGRPARWCKSRR